MQSVSGGFTSACKAAVSQPRSYVEISWDGLGAFADARGAAHWTNESIFVQSHNGRLRLNAPGEELVAPGTIGQLTVVLSNDSGRFSWQNASCPLYAYIGTAVGMTGKYVRVWSGYVVSGTPEYVCIFSGVIVGFTPSTQEKTVTIDCRDRSYLYLQDKRNTALTRDQRPDEWIRALGTLAGLTSGEMLLDAGMFEIPWCWLDDESLIEEMWETARADNGTIYFDQSGKLRFETIMHWLSAPHRTVQWSFTELDYQQPDVTNSIDDVATQIVVEWAERSPQPETIIYTLDKLKIIPPNGSISWTARFSWPILTLSTPVAQVINNLDAKNNHEDDVEGDYAAISNGGVRLTDKLTITFSDISAQQCTVTVANAHTLFAAHLVYFQLQGIALSGRPAEQVKQDANPKPYPFERIRSVRGNIYVQTEQQGRAFIGYLAAKHARVRPEATLKGVPAVPQLEFGDLVDYYDRSALGSGNTKQGFVIGIDWTQSSEGYWQDLLLLDAQSLWEYSDYFIIGTTALGHHGRAWY